MTRSVAELRANPLAQLTDLGQSIWLDYLRRSLVTSGELARLIKEDELRGVTSNPAIFEKAITGSTDYREALASFRSQRELTPKHVYELIAVRDVQDAADVLRPVYEETRGRDGFVSLEVSPRLAHDAEATVDEGRRLWSSLSRPNVMIKVPATDAGFAAIERLTAEGVNVNVTLLFSLERYEKAAWAYIRGLQTRVARGDSVLRVASVASFFVSRIDSAVDALVEKRLAGADRGREALLRGLLGKVAIANAKLAYQRYQEIVGHERWRALASAGAQTQRLLWASTGVKNPRYRDVMYVEELIGPDTVDTMPPATLAAFRQHGAARRTIDDGVEAAYDVMDALAEAGISLEAVTERVLADGVRLFAEPFDRLLATIEEKTRRPEPPRFEHQSCHPSKDLAPEIPRAAEEWQAKGGSRRLWSRDASLWTGADEAGWLGWLGVVDEQLERRGELAAFRDEIRDASFAQALLLGMGGSSLAAEALSSTFGSLQGFPRLLVVDSTDPEEIARAEARIRPAETLVLVASKSGSTLETNLLKEYFFSRFERRLGRGEAGKRFIAVTDPASKLELLARAAGFRRVFHGVPSIGGRYGALSDFGMVPAAILGLDCAKLLDRAHEMVVACSSFIPAEHNPGVMLGVILGTMAVRGRNKVTLLSSPSLDGLGPWIEQLLAESTGKTGRGVVPVEGEPLGSPQDYGDDRVFVYTRLDSDPPGPRDAALARLEEAGHPVVRIDVGDVYDIGQEFFRWELATAVLGSLLGVNPFDQPDVEASKAAARALTREFERSGALPAEAPFFESDAARVYAPAETARRLSAKARERTLPELLRAHLDSLRPGDYWAELVYLAREERSGRILEDMRAAVRSAKRTATCLGYGPRFLHSTGQLHKGGPDAGVFLQITCDDRLDLAVPGHPYTFGTVKAAQARGDLEALSRRGRRVLRVHLRSPEGLERLRDALLQALK